MIAESTPFGGIVTGDEDNEAGVRGSTWNKVPLTRLDAVAIPSSRHAKPSFPMPTQPLVNKWFSPVLSFINRHDVRVWSYINCDWDSFPMWQVRRSSAPTYGLTSRHTNPLADLPMWQVRSPLSKSNFEAHTGMTTLKNGRSR